PTAQGGAWECAVERLRVRVSPADLDPGGGGVQLQIAHTVPTVHHVRLEKAVPTVGEATSARGVALTDGPPQAGPAHGGGAGPCQTQCEELPSGQLAHCRPSPRVCSRSRYSSVVSSPRA